MSIVDIDKGEQVIQHLLEGEVRSIKRLEDKRFIILTSKNLYLVDISQFTNPHVITT